MPATILSSFVASHPTESWVEHFEYTPSDPHVVTEKGKLFAILSMDTNLERKTFLSQTVFTQLSEQYYASSGSLEDLKKIFNEVFEVVGEGELLCACVLESKLLCVTARGASVSLIRSGTYATLVRSKEKEMLSLSGFVKPGDIFVFGTHTFFDHVTKDMLTGSVSSRSPEIITEFLHPMIQVHNDGSIGAWFVKIQETSHENAFLHSKYDHTTQDNEVRQKTELQPMHRSTQSLAEKPIYLKAHIPNTFTSPKKTPMVLGICLVLVLIASMVFGSREQAKKEKENMFQTQIANIQSKLDESQTLSRINPERARQLFGEAQSEVEHIPSDPVYDSQVNELKSKIESLQVEILGEHVLNFSQFVDLSLLSDGFTSSQLTSNDGVLYILDANDQKIARVSLISKRAEIIAGPSQVEEVTSIASYADSVYGMSGSDINRIVPTKTTIADGVEDGLLFTYAGNLYVLDKNESQIYRYAGFSTVKQSWLTEGVTTDLSDATSWIIDGTMWVLKENGEIKRFSGGNPFAFSLYGSVPAVTNPVSFYTNENIDNLYVLEPANSRIVVVTKGGEFVIQYVSSELKNAKFLVVSEEDKKVFIVTEDKVFTADIS